MSTQDTFDPDRFLGRSYAKDEFSPFGAHRLACLGERVTLAVARTFTEGSSTVSTSMTRDGPTELGSWGHWAPSSRWRLALIRSQAERGREHRRSAPARWC